MSSSYRIDRCHLRPRPERRHCEHLWRIERASQMSPFSAFLLNLPIPEEEICSGTCVSRRVLKDTLTPVQFSILKESLPLFTIVAKSEMNGKYFLTDCFLLRGTCHIWTLHHSLGTREPCSMFPLLQRTRAISLPRAHSSASQGRNHAPLACDAHAEPA